jgi:hypothetical protein
LHGRKARTGEAASHHANGKNNRIARKKPLPAAARFAF